VLTAMIVLKVLDEVAGAEDRGDLAMLMLLDLAAAFDMVDHKMLLPHLKVSYGVSGMMHRWFISYQRSITFCTLPVIVNASQSHPVRCPTRIDLGTNPFLSEYIRPAWSS